MLCVSPHSASVMVHAPDVCPSPPQAVYADAVEVSSESHVSETVLDNMCRVAAGATLHRVFAGDNCNIQVNLLVSLVRRFVRFLFAY